MEIIRLIAQRNKAMEIEAVKGNNQMKKVFISQPMRGRADEVIKAEREYITDKISAYYREYYPKESIEVIDSFLEDTPSDAKPLWFLGKSLELLSTADVAVFAPGWESARGCVIEHECAVQYGVQKIVEF